MRIGSGESAGSPAPVLEPVEDDLVAFTTRLDPLASGVRDLAGRLVQEEAFLRQASSIRRPTTSRVDRKWSPPGS